MKPKKPLLITRKKLAIGVLVALMIGVPGFVGYKYVEPLIFRPARQLFSRLPVVYSNLSPIPIRYRRIISIPVRVIPKGAYGIRVTHKDLSRIPVIHKNSTGIGNMEPAEGEEETPRLKRMRIQHTFRSGLQRPTTE